MAERPIFGNQINSEEQWAVASDLIAISPELQRSVKRHRQGSARAADSKDALRSAADEEGQLPVGDFDQASAAELFEQTCSQ